MDLNLKNKIVLITGAASGIGAATAVAFGREGAFVVIADLQNEKGEELAHQIISEGSEAIFVKCDVAQEIDIRNLVKTAKDKYHRIDYAFNNAGIEGESFDTVSCSNENWDKTLAVNLKGIWLCLKHEIPEMLKNGAGSIVNCASIAGVVGFAGSSAYTASKHGVIGLTKAAAIEYAQKNIRINAICPGVIDTPMIARFVKNDKEAIAALVEAAPMGRMGKPYEIAQSVLWLCSDASSFVTGHSLVADGGWVAK